MRITFLGTAGALPSVDRAPSAVLLEREGERLLFDCGEGTQRQMMRFRTGFAIDVICITHLHGDHILGLPGLLQTMDFNGRTAPLELIAPPGGQAAIEELIGVGGFSPSFPLEIATATAGRAAVETAAYTVTPVATDHRGGPSVGYLLREADRLGRFDRAAAEALGVPPGPLFGRLHRGESVELADGRVIHSEAVVGPPRPGRQVLYTGDTRPLGAVDAVTGELDLLIHDATFTDADAARAETTGHSTAAQAAADAVANDAQRLALVHLSSRYGGDTSGLLAEARAVTTDATVLAPEDGETVVLPVRDAPDV
jgi:ribonuclease Z